MPKKKRTPKKTTKTTSSTKRNRKAHTSKAKHVEHRIKKVDTSYGWEMIPFVVAIVVAIVVVIQSIDSATNASVSRQVRSGEGIGFGGHMAAECEPSEKDVRDVRRAERATNRALARLSDAKISHDWKCSHAANSKSCKEAAENLQVASRLFEEQRAALQGERVEACS